VRDQAGEREIIVDKVISATGFEVDVDRIAFLSSDVKSRIRRFPLAPKAPRLSWTFESSVPGLYIIGPAAASSFGPLVRFVTGSYFAVPAVARHLAGGTNPVAALIRSVAPTSVVPTRREHALSETEL
jgi:hypothetical protein